MSTEEAPIIHTTAGTLAGTWESDNQIAVFKRIPYAQPPVGPLRWQPPQPLESWQGTRDTTKDGPIAWQREGTFAQFVPLLIARHGFNIFKRTAVSLLLKIAPKQPQSEDCLTLNVRTPDLDPAAKLPVMLWIHGGDHQFGSGSDPLYTSNALPRQDVVHVSINYRLGLMGFFAHPALSAESPAGVSSNYGTLDQIAALNWVQENIASFGGDPDNVTIFGESAGGESVAHLLTSPLASGLFHKAILQSPANSGQMFHLSHPFLDYPSGEEQGERFAETLGIGDANALDDLRQLSAADLYARARQDAIHGAFYPQIDGHVLPQSPFAAFHNGAQANVPLMIGSNADEGSLIHPLFPAPLIEYRDRPMQKDRLPEFVYEEFPHEIEELLVLYPGLVQREADAEQTFYGDAMFGSKARFLAGQAATAGQTTHFYHFTRVPPSPTQTVGAFHAAELVFVFDSGNLVMPMSEADKALSKSMITYWTNFAKIGDPNGAGLPAWGPFVDEQPEWMILDPAGCGMQVVDREQRYQLLNQRTVRHIELMQAFAAV